MLCLVLQTKVRRIPQEARTGFSECLHYNIGHDDLVDFANLIIKKTKEEDSRLRKEEAASEFYTRAEVKDLLHVCDSTLTKWAARKYLVPVRVGGKTMFRKTDVRKILDKR